MKKLSFIAAILALVLVGTSAFKSAHRSIDTLYGLQQDNNGDLIIIDLTGLEEGVTKDYDCSDNGTCTINLTSGTPVQDPEDSRKYTVEDGTYVEVEPGTFHLHIRP